MRYDLQTYESTKVSWEPRKQNKKKNEIIQARPNEEEEEEDTNQRGWTEWIKTNKKEEATTTKYANDARTTDLLWLLFLCIGSAISLRSYNKFLGWVQIRICIEILNVKWNTTCIKRKKITLWFSRSKPIMDAFYIWRQPKVHALQILRANTKQLLYWTWFKKNLVLLIVNGSMDYGPIAQIISVDFYLQSALRAQNTFFF